jgi:mono/diheme cytochrome c family protein
VSPDGALFVTDDVKGRIWRITFKGGPDITSVEAAPAPASENAANSSNALPPEGVNLDAGKAVSGLPIAAGATRQQVALGERVFQGASGGATCGGCHGSDAKGTPVGSDLTSGKWLWGDGSMMAITQTIADGVPNPKEHSGAMPPMGGVQLSKDELAAVAAYVWSVGHQSGR